MNLYRVWPKLCVSSGSFFYDERFVTRKSHFIECRVFDVLTGLHFGAVLPVENRSTDTYTYDCVKAVKVSQPGGPQLLPAGTNVVGVGLLRHNYNEHHGRTNTPHSCFRHFDRGCHASFLPVVLLFRENPNWLSVRVWWSTLTTSRRPHTTNSFFL